MQPSKFVGPALFLGIVVLLGVFLSALRPAAAEGTAPVQFTVRSGESFRTIAEHLHGEQLIRSKSAFEIFAFLSGQALHLKAGIYVLAPSLSTPSIVRTLALGANRETSVTIPDGASVFQIDELLSRAQVLPKGALIGRSRSASLEGRFYPDTYYFFLGSTVDEVLEKFRQNFDAKAAPALARASDATSTLILSSLVEREVPDDHDRRIVAGILKKRLAAGMPLQVDAAVCYAKQVAANAYVPCSPLSTLDLKMDSPYTTYTQRGLPPGPIGSPTADAIEAVEESIPSAYWFYLSDPATPKTIFSVTLDEHTRNRVKYLKPAI